MNSEYLFPHDSLFSKLENSTLLRVCGSSYFFSAACSMFPLLNPWRILIESFIRAWSARECHARTQVNHWKRRETWRGCHLVPVPGWRVSTYGKPTQHFRPWQDKRFSSSRPQKKHCCEVGSHKASTFTPWNLFSIHKLWTTAVAFNSPKFSSKCKTFFLPVNCTTQTLGE